MLRVSLIGAGDIDYHYIKLLNLPQKEFDRQIKDIAGALAGSNVELVLPPDRGAPFEVAREYKTNR